MTISEEPESDVNDPIAPRLNVALSGLTTFGIGGPADVLIEVQTPDDAAAACGRLRAQGGPVTFLGGGSNVLVADSGVRGVVLRFHGGRITREASGAVRADAGVSVNGLARCTGMRISRAASCRRW
jgi:UDP-N-acetylmuramate dehydrogenase